jgi:predicted ATP-grasp superfamily ATP-dependent carboligase
MAERSAQSWLIGAWPGMGNVAVIAAGALVQQFKMRAVGELTLPGHFDIQAVEVSKGVVSRPRLPRSVFFRPEARAPGGPDLTVFLAEAQPAAAAFDYAHALLQRAREWKVDRVITFASMASQVHPTERPRVFGAATTPEMLLELERIEVARLEEGQIGGMNGVLLGAAIDLGLQGVSLLGEIPFFAAAVGNPKAARMVLDSFAHLAGLEIDLSELDRHAEVVDKALVELLERIQSQHGEEKESEFAESLEPDGEREAAPREPALDDALRARIEKLFAEAAKDRSKAVGLKSELDRLGVFKQYENRFLDLFRRAE